jgi:alcohol dehydrogenase class IV
MTTDESPTRGFVLWASDAVRELARRRWPLPTIASLELVPSECPGLIVVGGGARMDEAKYFRRSQRPGMRLVLVPSLWGSGAESSPVVVLNREGAKQIEIGSQYLPDEVIYWPELLHSVDPLRARHACGDAWSHALEAFLSPLAAEPLQAELAALIQQMLTLPLTADARWFEASSAACRMQASASVGLVHGIAHELEAPLTRQFPADGWGHAKLCSIFLLPVMELNQSNSSKWQSRCAQHAIDPALVTPILEALSEPEAYRQTLPLLAAHWQKILRNPCTRTNGTLVRPAALRHFEEWPVP